MRVSPVSFGSLMVVRMKKRGTDHTPIEDMLRLSFPDSNGRGGNKEFKSYRLSELRECGDEDFTVYNATKDFAQKLDLKYQAELDKNPHKVILTKGSFQINPRGDKVEKIFLTAVNSTEEAKIHKVLCKSEDLIAVNFLYGRPRKKN